MSKSKHLRLLLIFVYSAAAILIAWFSIKFLLPWLSPFILAFITAGLTEPVIAVTGKRLHLRRGFVSAVCTAVFLLSIIGIIAFLSFKIFYESVGFLKELPSLISGIPKIALSLESTVNDYISTLPPQVRSYLADAIKSLASASVKIPALLSEKLLTAASAVISSMPKIIFFTITYTISVFFISASYTDIKAFLLRQIPNAFREKVRSFKTDIISTFGKWVKAQLMLMGITFTELCLAFFILGINYAGLLAFATALIDALPVFGTGTVLIPWAIFELISGGTGKAIGLFITYCVIALVRSFLEPKFIGKQIGLSPIVTLIAIYIGFCCAGVMGMIIFPLVIITLKQCNDKGYIKLWK